MTNPDEKQDERGPGTRDIAVYSWLLSLCVGLAIGVAVGAAIGRIGAGVGIGMGLGVAVGLFFVRRCRSGSKGK